MEVEEPTHPYRHRLVAGLHLAQIADPFQLLLHGASTRTHLLEAVRRSERDGPGPDA